MDLKEVIYLYSHGTDFSYLVVTSKVIELQKIDTKHQKHYCIVLLKVSKYKLKKFNTFELIKGFFLSD